MAKKKSASGFNMAQELRALLKGNRSLSGTQAFEELVKKFPSEKINKNSCGVAFYGARNSLGIKSKKRGGGKLKPAAAKKVVIKRTPAATGSSVDMVALQAAAKYVSEVGDAAKAIEAIRQLRTLQIQ